MARKAKPKVVPVEVIDRTAEGKPRQCYEIMDKLVGQHHPHLAEAKIALAWHYGWKPNKDGQLTLGRAKKASDLDRELHGFDFCILLNYSVWNRVDWTQEQMEALLDHELCHCEVALDKEGDPKRDQHGRPVWRMRKHDIEEFRDIVQRHGLWKQDLQEFARLAMKKGRGRGLFQEEEVPAPDPLPATVSKALNGGTDQAMLKAVRDLCPKAGSGLDSITISTSGRAPVTLTSKTREKINRQLRESA